MKGSGISPAASRSRCSVVGMLVGYILDFKGSALAGP